MSKQNTRVLKKILISFPSRSEGRGGKNYLHKGNEQEDERIQCDINCFGLTTPDTSD